MLLAGFCHGALLWDFFVRPEILWAFGIGFVALSNPFTFLTGHFFE